MMNEKLEDILLKKGYLVTMPSGSSMLPLIRPDRDTVVIKRRIPKKYDVVLYKRDNGKYILHRVLKIKDKEYALRFRRHLGETPQYGGRILAVGISYDKVDKKHSCAVEVLSS